MEAAEKVYIAQAFNSDPHVAQGCVGCHGGVSPAVTRAEAHVGMVAAPSKGEDASCGQCHAEIVERFPNSLHNVNRGIYDIEKSQIVMRANPEKLDVLQHAMDTHCSGCHIQSCGDCHVSRPEYADTGFGKGHVFYKEPKPTVNCTACHGSRIEKEMLGKGGEDWDGEEVKTTADVHWNPGGMKCSECHAGGWPHGDQSGYDHRYDVDGPTCEGCHADILEDTGGAHGAHATRFGAGAHLQCQVCHAQPYNNCSGCHVARDEDDLPFFRVDKSWFDFKIAKNPLKSERRPYDYVLVRHVPVSRDTFAFYGEDILTNYDALPTWKYATPHNIKKGGPGPQAESCDSCHGHPELFLTEEAVAPDERVANEAIIVSPDEIP